MEIKQQDGKFKPNHINSHVKYKQSQEAYFRYKETNNFKNERMEKEC